MKLFRLFITVLALCCTTLAMAEPVAGKDYTLVEPAQPTNTGDKIEVLEFFFYGCSHCYKLHPVLSRWEKSKPKDVELIHVPTVFNPNWEPMARTFYALESMGQQKKLDDALFDAWNVNNNYLTDQEKATDFVVKQGIDRKTFSDAYNAFSTGSKVMRNKQMQSAFKISGTPTLIVDGKYRITGLHPEDTIKVLTAMVDKARKERGSKKR